MSDTEERNNKRPNRNGAGPTRSFDGSVIGPGGQIGPFRIERELGRGRRGNSALQLFHILLDCEGYYAYPIS
jgi:hypothetical protein